MVKLYWPKRLPWVSGPEQSMNRGTRDYAPTHPVWLMATMAAGASESGLQNQFIISNHPSCIYSLQSTMCTSLFYGFVDDCGLESRYCIFGCRRHVLSRCTIDTMMELIQLWCILYLSNVWFPFPLSHWLLYRSKKMAWNWHLILCIFHLTINRRHLDIHGCSRYPQGGMSFNIIFAYISVPGIIDTQLVAHTGTMRVNLLSFFSSTQMSVLWMHASPLRAKS